MSIHNYIDKWTCIAMMNKNCTFVDDNNVLSFNKTKNGSKAAAFSFDYKFDPNIHKQVSWLYLNDEPEKDDFNSVYSLEEIVSKIEVSAWFWEKGKERPYTCLQGQNFIEWRGTVNKWRRYENEGRFVIELLNESNVDKVLEMIEKWRYMGNGGMKYGWQERAGCDKALVRRYVDNFENIQDYVIGNVFKFDNEVVGYSCIEKISLCSIDGIPEFQYLTRKVLITKGHRNIT